MSKFKSNGGPNQVLNGKDFYVSYLPLDQQSNPLSDALGNLATLLSGNDEHSHKKDETALVKDGIYYILNGDFRKEYEELIAQGFPACLQFYEANKKEHGSCWSTIRE